LVVRLGERRVFQRKTCHDLTLDARGSVREIRGWLTESLTELPPKAAAYRTIRSMREACNEYLSAAETAILAGVGRPSLSPELDDVARHPHDALVAAFRNGLERLAADYDLRDARRLATRAGLVLEPAGRDFR